MASRIDGPSSHLDATGGREVVYCHACANEWYRDEHGLTCPACQSDIIEIVSPDNDPRELDNHHHSSDSTCPEIPHLGFHADFDPDEADIEEHLRGDHGFVYNGSTREGPGRRRYSPQIEPVIHRFIDMVSFGGAQGLGGPPGRQPHPHFYHDEHLDDFDMPPHRPHYHQYGFGQPRIHRTTFRRRPFGGGTAGVTIFSGPLREPRGEVPPMESRGETLQEIFPNALSDMGPPSGDPQHLGAAANHRLALIRSLQEIMGLLSPANAMAGDAVDSHEALDQIISNLIEANPQSNAAPPASEEAIRSLERKPVDKEMLAGETKTECTICTDEIQEGGMALFLLCKHWFHENCVVLWLREHNTCPICRTPIEKNERGENSGNPGGLESNVPPNNPSGAGPSSPWRATV